MTVGQSTTDVSLPVLPVRKRSRLRWTVLILAQVLIIVHIIVWLLGKQYGWFGGKTITPIEPSEGMEFVKHGVINAGAIFFALALLSTLIFGRWFCGWACHIVLLQDFCYSILRKMHIRPKPFRARILMWFPFGLAAYMFLWPLFERFVMRPEMGWTEVSTHLVTTEFWSTFASPLVAVPFLLVCGFATVYVLGAKGFCTYGCPYGGFFKPLDAISPMRVHVNDDCQQCGKCTAACTSNVKVHEEVNLYKMVIDSGCMKTSDCIDACPNDALHIGFGKIAIGQRQKPRTYDLSLKEELFVAILFLMSFIAFRGMYAAIPMLMAVGMALVGTWVVWKGVTVLSGPNANFHRYQLRFHGKLKPAGAVFLSIATLVLLFTVNSIALGVLQFAGDNSRVNERYASAIRYYKLSGPMTDGGIGLASNPNIDVTMSKIHESLGEFQEAQRLLLRVDRRVGPDEKATMLLGQNMQLHKPFLTVDTFYSDRLQEHPDWPLVWEDYVAWLKRERMLDRAVQISRIATNMHPHARRLHIQRALVEMEFGDIEVSVDILREITANAPNDRRLWMLFSRALYQSGRNAESNDAAEKAESIRSEQ